MKLWRWGWKWMTGDFEGDDDEGLGQVEVIYPSVMFEHDCVSWDWGEYGGEG